MKQAVKKVISNKIPRWIYRIDTQDIREYIIKNLTKIKREIIERGYKIQSVARFHRISAKRF